MWDLNLTFSDQAFGHPNGIFILIKLQRLVDERLSTDRGIERNRTTSKQEVFRLQEGKQRRQQHNCGY
jgi:hypothetical protein